MGLGIPNPRLRKETASNAVFVLLSKEFSHGPTPIPGFGQMQPKAHSSVESFIMNLLMPFLFSTHSWQYSVSPLFEVHNMCKRIHGLLSFPLRRNDNIVC